MTKTTGNFIAGVESGQIRVVIEGVLPEVDGGRFPIKRVCGETVTVEADVFADGHDAIACVLRFRHERDHQWSEVPMLSLGNDRWRAAFPVTELGRYWYTVEGWVDHFTTWQRNLQKRIQAGQSDPTDLLIGARIVDNASSRAAGTDAVILSEWAIRLESCAENSQAHSLGLDSELTVLVTRYPDRNHAARYYKNLAVVAERLRARTGAWYEMFPRSRSGEHGRHGTFADCVASLPYISKMGFDVLYLPPIHPIGTTKRKGKNNAETAQPGDVGSPWAIGSYHGGHTAIEPALGTFDDFRKLVVSATELGLEIAIDLAFQCSPDHPWVSEHPEWFRQRPDGTIQYAENPPKKYQDIYPIDFETESWRSLWQALLDVVLFWAGQDIRIFRVDNPHTKAFPFWEWMIDSVRQQFPDAIFLAEAFTRPKVMGRLAKLGFAQSYTYFTWRNTKEELTQYLTELTASPSREYFRPNLWPNTPDILPEYLQLGGRAGFMIRIGLAATLGASYGIYGPAFELCHSEPRTSGSEEYLNSEKYEIQSPDLGSAWSLRDYIARINAIRKENLALQESWNLQFHEIDNPLMICYSKVTADGANVIVVVVNLDSGHGQAGWTNLDLPSLRIESGVPYQAHDLLGGGRYLWNGPRNYVELSVLQPLHVLQLRRKSRTERDFDYYL